MNKLAKVISTAACSSAIVVLLAGCGSAGADQVKALCDEADAAMGKVTLDHIVPEPQGDWDEVAAVYYELKEKLLALSDQASELGETQLARDFSSVSKGAGSAFASASLISMVGYESITINEFLSSVNEFTHNEALRSPGDRTFLGCN